MASYICLLITHVAKLRHEMLSSTEVCANTLQTGGVEYRDVVFGYSVGDRVLHGVSFSVGGGQTVALVGATGSGKVRLQRSIVFMICSCTSHMMSPIIEASITLQSFSVHWLPMTHFSYLSVLAADLPPKCSVWSQNWRDIGSHKIVLITHCLRRSQRC